MRISGYAYGAVWPSFVPMDDLAKLKAAAAFGEEDERYLRMAGDVLEDQVEEILDLWYGLVGSVPHLLRYFTGPEGQPLQNYLQAVRGRFGQWSLDTCRKPYDSGTAGPQRPADPRFHA